MTKEEVLALSKEDDRFKDDWFDGYEHGIADEREEIIDEFVKILTSDELQRYTLDCVFETSSFGTYTECIDMFIEYVNAIAEQMKGEHNE